MPHLVIELSDNLANQAQDMVYKVQQAALSCGLFDAPSVKSRAIIYQHFALGNLSDSFIHIQARILSGRNEKQKQELSDCLLDCLQHYWPNEGCLSVEIVEMNKQSYRKQQK
ncbi:5-carboxymethyl-2-hydroxymuconate Delta-isomerase [Pseudoalteromonas tunicata]|jgi:5-carboxymethyl-2-hydroxymuconate isomerase|uniref:Putative 5-carboxymethyl-2-hydroxymuconate delta isomerase n=1 Tax=Pseudoalteromonas tunicata D2 TaxID=87626 RepID=A4C7M6_9GAMM|nr:5-carboxymethyl-2-hydroxymuconate Delta-isomerase [Pseudoalteromonas tunicata]ATC95951.1 5-carboxymethyl-2-hydroxymuconate isomerase [Pseudoalteromonas tunicata]AXT31487.1 5-carboxymethyl-2-hydroxymuconate Delta-isomerase [Pseudoalteromonas tunicata]EAR29980.1 putative 5-carboxymethyl-2-hydroxymuconate delta isomerase [Pseudoalteromonas tunicata D2]